MMLLQEAVAKGEVKGTGGGEGTATSVAVADSSDTVLLPDRTGIDTSEKGLWETKVLADNDSIQGRRNSGVRAAGDGRLPAARWRRRK
jgi:hypothetical protein